MQLVTAVKVHDEVVLTKLQLMKPRIIATNRALTTAMLEHAKAITAVATPTGPGHFGYHGRDTLKVEVHQKGLRTVGSLRGAIQMYWREYGTGARFRGGKGRRKLGVKESRTAGSFLGGEPAFMTAHKALAGFRTLVRTFYSATIWWRL